MRELSTGGSYEDAQAPQRSAPPRLGTVSTGRGSAFGTLAGPTSLNAERPVCARTGRRFGSPRRPQPIRSARDTFKPPIPNVDHRRPLHTFFPCSAFGGPGRRTQGPVTQTECESIRTVPMSSRPVSCQSSRTTFLVARPDATAVGAHASVPSPPASRLRDATMEVSVFRIVHSVHTFDGATAAAGQS